MTDVAIDELAEDLVRAAAEALAAPLPHECLLCYIARMLDEFRCDRTLRFALEYHGRRARRAADLVGGLGAVGGSCDCEIFLHGWSLHPRLWSPGHAEVEGGVTYRTDPRPPERLPGCASVREGSSQPCGLWVRRVGRAAG